MANLSNGAALSDPAALKARSLELHETFRGKIQSFPKCPIHGLNDFVYWYTPGVAEPCREIERNPEDVYRYTNKGTEAFIRAVKALEPSIGAINLEDIAQPGCFTILDRLRDELSMKAEVRLWSAPPGHTSR